MLSELFDFVLNNYIMAKNAQAFAGHPLGECVRSTIPGILRLSADSDQNYNIKGSVGQGNWATVPWIAVMNGEITTTTQHGVYVVYLFSSDGKTLYLTLNQGCTDLIAQHGSKQALIQLAETANYLKTALGVTPQYFPSASGIKTGNAYYDAGCIAFAEYNKGSIPNDDVLLADLKAICVFYDKYVDLGKTQTAITNNSSKQPRWNKYEAALLLSAYLESKKGFYPESYYIQSVSDELRQMATNQGIAIDEAYRNVAGITFQMKSMASAFSGSTIVKQASKLFSDVVELYRNNQSEWVALLREAKELASPSGIDMLHNVSEVKAMDNGTEKIPNVAMTATQIKVYLKILGKDFSDGFNLESAADLQKFKDCYYEQRGISLKPADSSIISRIAWLGHNYDLQVIGSLSSALAYLQSAESNNTDRVPSVDPREEKELLTELLLEILKAETQTNSQGTTAYYIRSKLPARVQAEYNVNDVTQVLRSAPWAVLRYGRYFFREPAEAARQAPEKNPPVTTVVSSTAGQTASRKKARKYFRDDKENYYCWLRDVKGLAENTCAAYVSAISRADDYAKSDLKGARVLGCSKEEAKATFELLIEDSHFIPYFDAHTQQFKLYFEYMGLDVEKRSEPEKEYENEIETILKKNRVPYTRSSSNYLFIKKKDIAYPVLRKVRACQQTISVTSFFNAGSECWRVRFDAAIAPSQPTARSTDPVDTPRPVPAEKRDMRSSFSPATVKERPVDSRVVTVLRNHYDYGFNCNSPIELMRFKSYYEADNGSACELEDVVLKGEIKRAGFEFEGKVYLLSDSLKDRIRDTVLTEIKHGVNLFYISEIYSENEEWLFEEKVVDQGMLLALIKGAFPELYFKQTHFCVGNGKINEMPAIANEIIRVWGTATLQTYSELKGKLPFIPFEKIKYALSVSDNFVWNAPETYTRKDYFRIDKTEIETIRSGVERGCRMLGSVSFDDIDLESIAAENYELSPSAIKDLVFSFLSVDFDRNQQVITKKGEKQDAASAIADYCRKRETCTMGELEAVMKNVSGTVRLPVIIEAANSVMVRISEEQFVSDSQIEFNVELIDEAIDNIVRDDSIGMQEVTTFSSFPFCGYAWNLFLLESYCRRFSYKYKYEALSANSRNAGAIIKKSCGFDYHELMAISIAGSNVGLNEDEVFDYLIATGYLVRRKYSNMDNLIERAAAIRERGN